jgi:Zn-dependent M28 family amino/carboxypeptidase
LWAPQVQDTVAAIAKGADNAQRRAAITAALDNAGLAYTTETFEDARKRSGVNVIVSLDSGAAKTLLLGAHYDRVEPGQGVLDNGASCAVLLGLLRSVKAQPLRNYNVRGVFFDLEEGGLGGSRAYLDTLRRSARQMPDLAVNLDIFGYGDSFFATASNALGPPASALKRAGADAGLAVQILPPAQYPSSDHNSMIAAGIDTLGIALIADAEIRALLSGAGGAPPRVLTIIHTANDTLDVLRVAEVEKGAAVLEQFLRLLDEDATAAATPGR